MEYTTLGDTGTTVSQICLSCMSFGSNDRSSRVTATDHLAGAVGRHTAASIRGLNTFTGIYIGLR
jgi:aryl-alcohol dehydrogenase-like predicted oxidoreductase